MEPLLNHRSLWSLDVLSGRDVLALLETACALKRAGRSGVAQRLLRGKNVALLSDAPPDGQGNAFDRAAVALGAHVAHIRPADSGLKRGDDVSATARMLGRLYDAIECEGLDDEVVGQLERHAGVPVFNGLALPQHPTHVLADLMTMSELCGKPLPELRLCVVGPTASSHATALRRAAELAGVGVHDSSTHGALPCNPTQCGADYLYDEQGTAPALKAAHDGGSDARFDAERDENQRYALQAMLLSTIT